MSWTEWNGPGVSHATAFFDGVRVGCARDKKQSDARRKVTAAAFRQIAEGLR